MLKDNCKNCVHNCFNYCHRFPKRTFIDIPDSYSCGEFKRKNTPNTKEINTKTIKFTKLYPGVITPKKGSQYSSGYDIHAHLEKDFLYTEIPPAGMKIIPTGLCLEIPHGYEGQVRPRSGLGFNYGIMSFFGTIDSDYRGELKGLLFNFSHEPYIVKNGDRIAQIVFCKTETINLKETTEINSTVRGGNGFGSTGV